MNRGEITKKIDDMVAKLEETKKAAGWDTGPVNDTLQLVIPMLEDQLEIMKIIVREADGFR